MEFYEFLRPSALFSRMIYALCTINACLDIIPLTCTFIMTFSLVLIRSKGIFSRFIFGHFYLLVLISNPVMDNARARGCKVHDESEVKGGQRREGERYGR